MPTTRAALFAAVPGLRVAEALFATSRDQMFCIKNCRREYVAVNQAFVLRSRVRAASAVLGKTAAELFPPLLAAGYDQQDGVVLLAGRAFTDKLELITNPDGSTGWYLTQKQPVLDPAGRAIAIVSVSADLGRPTGGDPRLAAVAEAVDLIQRGFGEPLRIEAIARAAGMSLSQLERRTRGLLRMSPRQLLTQTRVEAAAKALRETTAPLTQVAADCGFYDQAQFCRQFRSATGLTPGRYRRSAGS